MMQMDLSGGIGCTPGGRQACRAGLQKTGNRFGHLIRQHFPLFTEHFAVNYNASPVI